jgi:hypothetical protein
MQIGIAAYFRNVAVRCSRLANSCKDSDTKEGIEALAVRGQVSKTGGRLGGAAAGVEPGAVFKIQN